MRNMMDLSSIIYQLHSVRFLRLMRLHRESELKRQNAEDIETFSVGPSIVNGPSFIHHPLESRVLWVRIYPDFFPHKLPSIDKFSKNKNETFSVSKRGYVIFSTGELTPMFPPEGTS